MKKPKLPSNKG